MPSYNKTGRSNGTPGGYVKIDRYILRCPAWKALNPYAKCLYIALKSRYRNYGKGKTNNGRISLSHNEAIEETGCSDRGIRKAFPDLMDKGFVVMTRDSSFSIKVALAREFALTEHPVGDRLATKDFMQWRPDEEKNTVITVDTDGDHSGHRDPNIEVHKVRESALAVITVDTVNGQHGDHCGHTSNSHRVGEAHPEASGWIKSWK